MVIQPFVFLSIARADEAEYLSGQSPIEFCSSDRALQALRHLAAMPLLHDSRKRPPICLKFGLIMCFTAIKWLGSASGFVAPINPDSHRARTSWTAATRLTSLPSAASSTLRISLLKCASATIDKATAVSVDNEESKEGPLDLFASQFEQYYNRALQGKPAQLKGLFATGATWSGVPLSEGNGDLQGVFDALDQGRAFMIEPFFAVTGWEATDRGMKLEWQLSGTWPFPYRPRVRAAGTSFITLDKGTGKMKQVEEQWHKPWWRVVLEQASPKGWDLWHLYLTPPAEKPLYRVVKKLSAVEIREYYPRLVIELEQHDARPDVQYTEWAWILPDFAFTDELKLQGRAQYRETYVATSPVESCVERVDWSPPSPPTGGQQPASSVAARRIRHHVPVPSHLGLDPLSPRLPSPSAKDVDTEAGQAGRYVLQPRRFMAVRAFKGLTQTQEYGASRRLLLEWCGKEGLRTVKNEKGKSRVWVQQHGMKAGFNMQGNFCLGIYEQASYSDWGEIAVEVERDPSWDSQEKGNRG